MKAIDPTGGGHKGTEYTQESYRPSGRSAKPSKGSQLRLIDGPYGGKKPQS